MFSLSNDSSSCVDVTEDESQPPVKRKKKRPKRVFKQCFTKKWMNNPLYKSWLTTDPVEKDKPFCKICPKTFDKYVNNTTLNRHYNSKKHQSSLKAVQNQPITPDSAAFVEVIRKGNRNPIDDDTRRLELALTGLIAKKNYPMSLMVDLPKILKKHASDSNIIKRMNISRTKTTALLTNVLGPAGQDDIHRILKNTHFSIIADETTDRTTTKFMVIVARYYSVEHRKPVEEFLAMPEVHDCTAPGLKKLLDDVMDRAGIPKENIIGFAADNASVMSGIHAGLATLLRNDGRPWLAHFGCICHSFALCASAACSVLSSNIIKFANDIYNFICCSPIRKAEFENSQRFVNAENRKILYPSQTRWLVMEKVAKRLLQQWGALENYFAGYMMEKVSSAHVIYKALRDRTLQMYYCFLAYVLRIVNHMNVEFQSESVRLHVFLSTIETGLRTLMENFITEDAMKGNYVFDVDQADQNNLKPIKQMYFGAEFERVEAKFKKENPSGANDLIREVRAGALKFYQELCRQIKKRVNHNDPLLKQLCWVDPTVALSGNIKSLVPLYDRFSATIKLNLEKLNLEWRRITQIDKLVIENFMSSVKRIQCKKKKKNESGKNCFRSHEKDTLNDVETVDQHEDEERSGEEDCQTSSDEEDQQDDEDANSEEKTVDPSEFWNFLNNMTDGAGNKMFGTVSKFMRLIMSLPHSSASAERKFSKLKLIKTPHRNKINSRTLTALMHSDRIVPRDIVKWEISHELVQKSKNWKKKSD